MIKRFLYLFVVVLFLFGCGAKKRALAKKTKEAKQKDASVKDIAEKPKKDEFIVFTVNSTEEYIATFKDIAKSNMRNYGIPASIILAQGILESGSGKGGLTRKTNNHFGIKCHKGWEGDRDYHDDDEKGECFRKYNHPMFSFRDHALFLTSRGRYDFLFDLKKNNYKGWARGLKKAGYATDKKYPVKLIAIIERYKLYRYDKEVLKDKWKPIAEDSSPSLSSKTHIVIKGDTLYSLSRKYGLTIEKLMSLNKLESTNISIGQKLIVKRSK